MHVLSDGGIFKYLEAEELSLLPPPGTRGKSGAMLIRFPLLYDNYTYLLLSDREAIAVDPAAAGPLLELLARRDLSLTHVLITHHHADHAGGCPGLKAATGCRVLGPNDRRVPGLDQPVRDRECLTAGPFEINALHVPGHTRTHVDFWISAESFPAGPILFSGDCLLPAGCGRVIEGTYSEMWSSLLKLAELPGETVLLAGHEYTLENLAFALSLEPENEKIRRREVRFRTLLNQSNAPPASTLSDEKETNPFLRAGDPGLKRALGMREDGDVEVFSELRKRKDRFNC